VARRNDVLALREYQSPQQARLVGAAMRMPFGKHRGIPLEELPDTYLFWLYGLADLREPLRTFVNLEYRRRCEPPPRFAPPALSCGDPLVAELLEAGYKSLAKKYHPDRGGDLSRMQQINVAMDELRKRF
jgi:hypothetical protein